MTTTSTSSAASAPTGRINDELIERAHRAYRKAGEREREQPAAGGRVHVIKGAVRITLGNVNGDLTTCEVCGTLPTRIDTIAGAA